MPLQRAGQPRRAPSNPGTRTERGYGLEGTACRLRNRLNVDWLQPARAERPGPLSPTFAAYCAARPVPAVGCSKADARGGAFTISPKATLL